MLTRARKNRGFSIIEMVIALGIVALLFKLAVPSFRTWLQNTQIRTAAHSITDGMNVARQEAIHRNVPVQLQLTSLSDGTSEAWSVTEVTAGTLVQQWSSTEGASTTKILQPTGGIITFNALGRVVNPNPSDNSAPLLQVDVTSSNESAGNGLRNMRVLVGGGGNVRMCDPQLTQPDPRAC